MARFIINTHGRLQEWIADAKGYFRDEGLDYALTQHALLTKDAPERFKAGSANTVADNLDGAYQTYESGREASISCACHWTVNMAASNAHGRMYGDAYSVTPCGIFVPEASSIRAPADLAGVSVHVGNQSGSHYTTIQALETFMPSERIKLVFGGSPWDRVDQLLSGIAPAATLFGMQYYMMEQLGFRKILDCTFMIGALIPEGVAMEDVAKYYRALRRAQADIDVMHQSFTRFYANELPPRFADRIDVRRFGPGERVVFESYSREMFDETHKWVEERGILAADKVGHGAYEDSIALVA